MEKQAFTHGGVFHADDVFATALLKIAYPGIQIVRGFQAPEHFEGIVYDIGMGEFDHHQADARKRENGISYGAFGLLWEKLGPELVGDRQARDFDSRFVSFLDDADNGGASCLLSQVISWFNPEWTDTPEYAGQAFEKAVDFAEAVLRRYLSHVKAQRQAEDYVRRAAEAREDSLVVLERFVPWKEALFGTGKNFCIYPSARGGWAAQAVPETPSSDRVRVPFPAQWAGKSREVLEKVDKNLIFCHRGRFLINTADLDTAVRLCHAAEGLAYHAAEELTCHVAEELISGCAVKENTL